MLKRNRNTILYGLSMAALLFLLKWLELRLVIIDHATEIYIGAIALIFTCLGIWIALKLSRPHTGAAEPVTLIVTPPTAAQPDEQTLASIGISSRELEVLGLMAEGLSNQEIADRLFVSLNTVKTHCSRIFEKLGVNRRTQAIDKAKKLNIIP